MSRPPESPPAAPPGEGPALSVVMPCLNEADTLGVCIRKAQEGLSAAGLVGEIIVADNGSTDGSQAIARGLGVRVVDVPERGYGHALMVGIAAARAPWVLMGDADDSYDFREIPRFARAFTPECDLVQGCRLPSGGGTILPGAMPLLHRWWGNPMFSAMVRGMFRSPVSDVYCGLRAFRKEVVERLDLRCGGMEFATEMIIKASLNGARIVEVPITLHPDGRVAHPPHLRTFRDGWRTLRFFLMLSPRWLYLVPGSLLMGVGTVGLLLGIPLTAVGHVRLYAHTMVFSSLAMVVGEQAIFFALMTKYFAIYDGLLPADPRMDRFFQVATLERGLVLAGLTVLVGLALLSAVIVEWWRVDFGDLDYFSTLRLVIPGATLCMLGIQAFFSSFFLSILGMSRR